MDREKEIEEIAKVMCGGCADNKECMHCLCSDWYKAEDLYNAGYRKQSENTVDVVRCNDCMYFEQEKDVDFSMCTKYMRFRESNDFCSRAKMDGAT